MPLRKETLATLTAGRAAAAPLRILVVDDSRAQRRILALSLNRWGYEVLEAGSGEEALALCAEQAFDIVLSDWMMDGMSGPEFCRLFRALLRETYAYFILLTSKSDKNEVATGLEAGADDFLTKPVAADELRARLHAGERIIGMQRELVAKNRLIGSALDELRKLYDSLDRDLIEARKVQQTFVRNLHSELAGGRVSILFRASGHVGGDLAGWFPINERVIGAYSIDVSGHGVASAMMTARLAGVLSGASPDQNAAMNVGAYGRREAWPPEMVAYRFNRMMLDEIQVEQYFTMAYAEIDLVSGRVHLVQAGHPHPLILRGDGTIERVGSGGLPIGLLREARYERIEFQLSPGDRLFLLSDGLIECAGPDGAELGEEGLAALIRRNLALPSAQLLDALIWDLTAYMGSEDFPDDVSGLMFDFDGRPG